MNKDESQEKNSGEIKRPDEIYEQVAHDVAITPLQCYKGELMTVIENAAGKAEADDKPTTVKFTFAAVVKIDPSGAITTDFSGSISIEDKTRLAGFAREYDVNQESFDFDGKDGE